LHDEESKKLKNMLSAWGIAWIQVRTREESETDLIGPGRGGG
jgi:hypothetical protein